MKKVFDSKWFSIEEFSYNDEDFYRLLTQASVVILALNTNKDLILVKQFRPCVNKFTYEMPAGSIDKNENSLNAAKRELYEETGFKSNKWDFLGSGIIRLERENVNNFFYFARDCHQEKNFKCKEDIKVDFFSKKKFSQLVQNNEFDHIASLPSIFWAKLKFSVNIL